MLTVPVWPNSGEILPAAFAGTGTTVVSFRQHSVEPSGGGYLYGYEVDTRSRDGVTATVLTYIDTDPESSDRTSPVVTDSANGERVRVWAYPADPQLPALAEVTYPERVVELLAAVGILIGEPTLAVVAYRPGKRAVIRVDAPEATLFLKVVRPSRAEPIARQHAAFGAKGLPVPQVLAARPDGLLVLERVAGVPAGSRVVEIAEGSAFVDHLVSLAQAVASVDLTQQAQADALDNAAWHRRSLLSSLPDRASEIDAVYDGIDRQRASWSTTEQQVIHGDLHLEQLFVSADDPGRITGMLDIDTAGLGHRARDAGALVAHLVVTAQWHRGNGSADEARACERIADDVVDAWTSRNTDIADRLPPTIASQLLAHAGGQASLGTDLGRTKAVQLLEAATGTMRVLGRDDTVQGSGSAPTVSMTPPV